LATVSAEREERPGSVLRPNVDSSLGTQLLPSVLSLTAGSVDVIGFLGLGGLFTAHITGNLVILAAHVVNGGIAPLAPILSVPVFMAVLGLTRLLAGGLEAIRHNTLRPLLALQSLLLAGFLVLCATAGSRVDPSAPNAIIGGMLGVAAMAVQSALVQISLDGAPSTAVMTTNITRFMMDIGALLFETDPRRRANAGHRAKYTGEAIIGFAAGCALGAAFQAAVGLWSLALPTGLALFALGLSFSVKLSQDTG
jgi:uncharacterized membrane protein YoaK (UPF0700 family)